MIPISSAVSGGLFWSKTPHQRGFQLRSNREIVGSLQKTSFWRTEFQADSVHGSWRFRRTGRLRMATEIVDAKSDSPIAIFKSYWCGGGTLVFLDRQTFQITCKGFWRPVWTVRVETGQIVLQIHSREKTVELPGQAQVSEDKLTLLAIFTWHIIRQAEEAAASTAALVAVAS